MDKKFVPGESTICPITMKVIEQPILNLCDNKVYEAAALETWKQLKNSCPTTRRQPLETCSVQAIAQVIQNKNEIIAQQNKRQKEDNAEILRLKFELRRSIKKNKAMVAETIVQATDEKFRGTGYNFVTDFVKFCARKPRRLRCGQCKYKTSKKWDLLKQKRALFDHILRVHGYDFRFLFNKYNYDVAFL